MPELHHVPIVPTYMLRPTLDNIEENGKNSLRDLRQSPAALKGILQKSLAFSSPIFPFGM